MPRKSDFQIALDEQLALQMMEKRSTGTNELLSKENSVDSRAPALGAREDDPYQEDDPKLATIAELKD